MRGFLPLPSNHESGPIFDPSDPQPTMPTFFPANRFRWQSYS
jgi:hypothetical protein